MEKQFIDKLAYIHIKNEKVLVTLSEGKDIWYIPGGKRKKDESDQEALTREIKEELNVDIVPDTIKHYGTFETQAHGKSPGTVVRMTCYMGDYKGKLEPSAEIEKLGFFTYTQGSLASLVDYLIFDDLKSRGLIK